MESNPEQQDSVPMIPFGILVIAPVLFAIVASVTFMLDGAFSSTGTSEAAFTLMGFLMYFLLGVFTLYMFMSVVSFVVVSFVFALLKPPPMPELDASLWLVAFLAVMFWLFALCLIVLAPSGHVSMPYGAGG